MTAEHAHALDAGGAVEALSDSIAGCFSNVMDLPEWMQVVALGRYMRPLTMLAARDVLASDWLANDRATTRNTAADAVLTEARRLCCGENPSAHHAATDKHSELMAFAGRLAEAVRGS